MDSLRGFLKSHDLAKVFLIWGVSRVVTFFAYLASFCFARNRFDFAFIVRRFPTFIDTWDARWYRKIFIAGYPHHLPHNQLGHVTDNAWAFFPAFPITVRGVNLLTHRGWNILSPAVAVTFGFLAAWVLFLIIRDLFDQKIALWAVILFSFCAVSPIFQTGYAESMALLFALWALRLTIQRKYLLALVPLFLWSLSRPGELAFALVFGALAMIAWRRKEPMLKLWFAAAASALFGFLWPVIAWASTAMPSAYFETENAWREGHTGSTKLYLVESWFISANDYFGQFFGPIVVVAVWALAVWILFLPAVKRLGLVVRLWLGAYFLYLVLVFYPQSSTFRLLIPNVIIVGALAAATIQLKAWAKYLVVGALILSQVLWILFFWDAHVGSFPP